MISDTWDNVSRDEIQSRERKVVDNYSQYCSVVETGIGGVSMILGGEVDARMMFSHPSIGIFADER